MIESLSYFSFEPKRGFQRFKKLHIALFSKAWYESKESDTASKRHSYKEEKKSDDDRRSEVTPLKIENEKKTFNEIDINDRERVYKGDGMAVLQFTKSAWEQLIAILEELDKQSEESEIVSRLSMDMKSGIWSRYYEEKKTGEKGKFLHILAGRFIFNTVFQEDEQKNGASSAGEKKNYFLVVSTKHARNRYANKEVNEFMDNGVFVKCYWNVNKPAEFGKRPSESLGGSAGAEIIEAVRERQNQYDALLQQKNQKRSFPKLEKWKEFIDISQHVEKETAKNHELRYSEVRPSPDYAVEGNVFRFYTEHGNGSLKLKEMVTIYDHYQDEKAHSKGTIREIQNKYIDIRIMGHYDTTKIPPRGRIRTQYNNRSYQIQMEAVDKIIRSNDRLADLVENPAIVKKPIEQEVDIQNRYIKNNPAQKSAVKNAVGAEELYFIQGPPGTGKTSVITEIIEQYVSRNQKVLITSQTNLAVDNVFEKIGEKKSMTSIRCGKEEKILDKVIPYKLENRAAALQQHISDHVEGQKERYVRLKQVVEKHRHDLNGLQSLYQTVEMEDEKVQQLEKECNRYREHAKVPSSKRVNQLKVQKRKTENELHKNQQRTDTWQRKVDSYLNLPGEKGFLLHMYLKILQYRIEKQEKRIEQYHQKIEQYEEQIQSCKEQIDHEIQQDNKFIQLKNRIQQSKEQMEQQKKQVQLAMEQLPHELSQSFHPDMSLEEVRGVVQELYASDETYRKRAAIMDEWSEYIQTDEASLHKLLMQNVDVVGATCIGLETDSNLDGIQFDVAIIDEASRATVPETLVPMSRAKKTILVGDHKQLPPTIKYEVAAACEENEFELPYKESLFEQLIDQVHEHNKIMLTTQFRMHPDISAFISKAFYNGLYQAGKGTEEKIFPSTFFNKPLCFIDTDHYENKWNHKIPGGGYENHLEASFVIKSLHQLILDYQEQGSNDAEKLEIGVITPYNKQKQLIMSKISQLKDVPQAIDIEVETLDAFQGREKDIIIYSFTRSNKAGDLGFTSELYRLNVGLSRARKLMILIGDSQTLKRARNDKINPILKDLIEYVLESGSFKVLWL